MAPGRPAHWLAEQLSRIAHLAAERTGVRPALPGVELLGERAAIAGFERRGPLSCGGSFRAVRTLDGWLGLSLARPEDVAAIPALVARADVCHTWAVVSDWAEECTTAAAVDRARLLGLAASGWPRINADRPGIVTTAGGARSLDDRPVVIDFTSLWAGPLCAHLLGLAGCTIVKVESHRRPDGARSGPVQFFDLLHGGHDSIVVDFACARDIERLHGLMDRSALVLESSRSRALRQMGLVAEDLVDSGTSWLSITAQGRREDIVGFGDDVAVGAGLALEDLGELLPVGDAIADPLTGVAAAVAAIEALGDTRAQLIDVSMDAVVRETDPCRVYPHAIVDAQGEWWVETEQGTARVIAPTARSGGWTAAPLGRDTSRWLS